MAPVIVFENVSKRFVIHKDQRNTVQEQVTGLFRRRPAGELFWAVRDVSFSVDAGESIGLVGHNGAGKSTILKLMTKILEPTSGTVSMNGRVAALLELGSGFHPDLSGRENVFLNGSLMGFSRKDMQGRLEEIIDFSGIGDFIDMEVKHYSSGMYTRLAFAVATAVDPDILITDEILSVGDEAFSRKCMERIFSFRREGRTIVFVSHGLETVRLLCDQAIWLDHGMPKAYGPASEVIDAYLADVNRQEKERLRRIHGDSVDDSSLQRRGSREVEIVDVEVLDGANHQQDVFRTHEPLTIRIHYVAHEPVEFPVFGLAIHHEAGLWLSGPNTAFDGMPIPEVRGKGFVDYHVPSLPLLAGRYLLTVAVYDEAMLHPYDHHERMYRLIVQSGSNERYGTVSLSGRWNRSTP